MKTQTSKHTPTPWHLRGDTILVSPRLIIAQCDSGTKHPDTTRANAEFICRAANEYEQLIEQRNALLEACKIVLEYDNKWGEWGSSSDSVDGAWSKMRSSVQSAIALCKPARTEAELKMLAEDILKLHKSD